MSDQNQKICTDCVHHSHRRDEGGWYVICRRFPTVIDPTDGSNVASSVPARRERKPQSKVDRWFKWERCGPDAVFFEDGEKLRERKARLLKREVELQERVSIVEEQARKLEQMNDRYSARAKPKPPPLRQVKDGIIPPPAKND